MLWAGKRKKTEKAKDEIKDSSSLRSLPVSVNYKVWCNMKAEEQ